MIIFHFFRNRERIKLDVECHSLLYYQLAQIQFTGFFVLFYQFEYFHVHAEELDAYDFYSNTFIIFIFVVVPLKEESERRVRQQ